MSRFWYPWASFFVKGLDMLEGKENRPTPALDHLLQQRERDIYRAMGLVNPPPGMPVGVTCGPQQPLTTVSTVSGMLFNSEEHLAKAETIVRSLIAQLNEDVPTDKCTPSVPGSGVRQVTLLDRAAGVEMRLSVLVSELARVSERLGISV